MEMPVLLPIIIITAATIIAIEFAHRFVGFARALCAGLGPVQDDTPESGEHDTLYASRLDEGAPVRPSGRGRPPRPLTKEHAFDLLFRKETYLRVLRWLERLAVPLRDRKDVAQNVFEAAFKSWHTYDPQRSRPERWLNKLTVNIAGHYHDRAHLRRERFINGKSRVYSDPRPSADILIATEEERLLLLELLQSIDPDVRSVLIAHDLDGIPMAEIAELRGIPLSTAYKWRARGIELLKRVAEERRLRDSDVIAGSVA